MFAFSNTPVQWGTSFLFPFVSFTRGRCSPADPGANRSAEHKHSSTQCWPLELQHWQRETTHTWWGEGAGRMKNFSGVFTLKTLQMPQKWGHHLHISAVLRLQVYNRMQVGFFSSGKVIPWETHIVSLSFSHCATSSFLYKSGACVRTTLDQSQISSIKMCFSI